MIFATRLRGPNTRCGLELKANTIDNEVHRLSRSLRSRMLAVREIKQAARRILMLESQLLSRNHLTGTCTFT